MVAFTIIMIVLIGISLICFRMIEMPVSQNKPVTQYELGISKCESPIEKRLYNGLVQHDLYPIPQYPVRKYRIDLALPGKMLAIECDGKAYHSTPKQKAHDRKRDKFLRGKGWKMLRFSGSKIHRDLPEVVNTIKTHMNHQGIK